jgi:ribosomal protein L11 methyltransferase
VFELVIRVPEPRVETVSDALLEELEALSISVEDADAGGGDEQPIFGEPGLPAPRQAWVHSTVQALFEDEPAATRAAAALLAQPWAGELHLQALQAVADADWVRLTQSQFAPVLITPEFWIVPTWHEVPATARRVIRLDPGLAFGTGTHPTTRMCLRWIARQAPARSPAWPRVLDYGCGSGILAIAACLHGAGHVLAVDIDPAAIESTRANALANGVDLEAAAPEAANGTYGLVLANILATPLKLLAPLLCAHLAPGGQLVLAGILERQRAELIEAYAPWVALTVTDQEDGWILMTATLTATRPADAR